MRCLITGGAGFIGSHLADSLIQKGYIVRAFDNLQPQVHGQRAHACKKAPLYLNPRVEFMFGDVLDARALRRALKGIGAVFHFASAVGIGQSMYEISRYTRENVQGTAHLLDLLANTKHKVKKLIVASSMSIYGEGSYRCKHCGVVYPQLRQMAQLKKSIWQVYCPICRGRLIALSTLENRPLLPQSVYAVSKEYQEQACLCVGRAYNIPTVALRFFNVYGPRQSLSNPYTGVAAIFASRILNKHVPVIFEDGLQSRDFIHVSDIVQANILALTKQEADYQIFNVGTGKPTTVLSIAQRLIKHMDSKVTIRIARRFREGDIRHCYANIDKIRARLGFSPKVLFKDGVCDLVEWAMNQKARDSFEQASKQLEIKGLVK